MGIHHCAQQKYLLAPFNRSYSQLSSGTRPSRMAPCRPSSLSANPSSRARSRFPLS